jgi:hypothetical protein
LLVTCFVFCLDTHAAEYSLERNEQGVAVLVDGELFTQYLTISGNTPVLWPIIGPTGKPMTRSWPIGPAEEGEHQDHVHQRSFWFAHEGVNGFNYWAEPASYGDDNEHKHHVGRIAHREFSKLESGNNGVTIVTVNDWLDPDGVKVCGDRRTLTFTADDNSRQIDFTIKLLANEGDVTFEDRKDGLFGVRVAASMKVDAEKGGQIINSRGQTNKGAWGQFADWVDYHGPIDGETVGIAILSHPSNFRHPTRWHVRDYGLFTANPLAEEGFPADDRSQGPHTIKMGDSLTLRYRVLLHRGDEKQAKIAEAFATFIKER